VKTGHAGGVGRGGLSWVGISWIRFCRPDPAWRIFAVGRPGSTRPSNLMWLPAEGRSGWFRIGWTARYIFNFRTTSKAGNPLLLTFTMRSSCCRSLEHLHVSFRIKILANARLVILPTGFCLLKSVINPNCSVWMGGRAYAVIIPRYLFLCAEAKRE
jgi:hypothetical protein